MRRNAPGTGRAATPPPDAPKSRARDLGLPFEGEAGSHNAITDVPGVEVGFTTVVEGDGPLRVGHGPVRTGVTAVLPRGHSRRLQPVWAGASALNGNGEMTGTHWIRDGGYFLGPICLTNTHAVGTAHHAAVRWMLEHHRDAFASCHLWAMPVVAETYDGVLNDINGLHLTERHVRAAIASAHGGALPEGNVGGGTGMICYGFKGGTGTSSRRLAIDGRTYHVGALVQANHGRREDLTILGVPVGRYLPTDPPQEREQGSIIVLIATDIPMLPHQLRRVARRAAIGIGRHGTPGGNSSGDIFLAFSVANAMDLPQVAPAHLCMVFVNDEQFDPIYGAACRAVEEAVVNALLAAQTMTALRPADRTIEAIDHGRLLELMRRYNRL